MEGDLMADAPNDQARAGQQEKSGKMPSDTGKERNPQGTPKTNNHPIQIQEGTVTLEGNLNIPEDPKGLVIFVHGSGSSRHSPRNQYVAGKLQAAGLATLLFDLLTAAEEELDLRTRQLRFDIDMLSRRTIAAANWLSEHMLTRDLQQGFFGASTGAAAALITAAERPELTGAVISRGGRPDLAAGVLPRIEAPTLLIVGQLDQQVIQLNEQALAQMNADTQKELIIVPGATHLFEEPGALEYVARLSSDWFRRYLDNDKKARPGRQNKD
jgi:putative phosphoribosyl transferase